MILYLDTSSLVKLYVDEDCSEIVREWVEEAEVVATSRVTYPEALSAFARRWNRGDLTDEEMSLARESFAGTGRSSFSSRSMSAGPAGSSSSTCFGASTPFT